MVIKKTSAYSSVAYVAVACQFMEWVGQPMRLNWMVSLSVAILTITTVIAFFFLCQDSTGAAYKVNDLTYLFLMVALVTLCAVLSHPVNMDLVKKLLVFFQLPVLLMVAKRAASKTSRDWIYAINAVYPILCVYYYNSSFSHRFVGPYRETDIETLTLGFNNPNEAAIYLMICAFLLLAALFRYKNRWIRVTLLAELLWMVFLIYQTRCRAAVFLIAAVVLGTVSWRQMKVTVRFVRVVFASAALFFVALYLLPALQSLTFMGDTLDTGRSVLFLVYINNLSFESFLFGDFQNYTLNNLHNAFLSIVAAFGIVSALLVWCFFYQGFKHICVRVPKSREHKALLLSCMAVVLHSAVEAVLLVNGVVYATFVFLILFMTSGCEREEARL